MGQSAADDPPLTSVQLDKDVSLSVKATQNSRVLSSRTPITTSSDHHHPTSIESLAPPEKERRESALLHSVYCHWAVLWGRCVCVCMCVCVMCVCIYICVCLLCVVMMSMLCITSLQHR